MTNKGPTGPQHCVSGVYNASGIALTDAQQAPVQMDSTGKILVNAGTITASLGGFTPSGTYTSPLSVSSTTGNTAINGSDPVQVVTNTGSVTAYVNLGASNAVTATTSDIPISAGASVALTVGSNTYLAAITSTGSTTLNIAGGSGLLTGIAGSPSVSGSNPAAGSTGSAVPSSASYDGLNVGGTLRGQTGVNPSGSVYAAQTDLSSVGGTTLVLGQAAMSASLPVAIASNQSAFPVSINQATPGTTNLVDASNFPVTVDTNAGAAGASTLRVAIATGGATPLPTGAATSANQPTNSAQGATTSGQTGNLAMGAASTSAPSYSNGQTNPLSLDLAGNLRVNVVTGGAGGGAVFGPTAVGSAAANPPVLLGGTANAGAAGNVQVAKVDSSGNLYTSTVLAAGSAAIGSITNTVFAVTQGTAASLNATVVGTGTFAVQAAVPSVSATGSAVPADGDYLGLLAKTSNPTAASDGNLVGAMGDKLGRLVTVIGNVRDNKASNTITLSSTSSATLVAGIASTFNDIYGLIAANQSATGVTMTLSSSSGATGIPIYIPANDTRGFMLPSSDGLKQNTVNTNWTAALSAGSITVKATALYVKNI